MTTNSTDPVAHARALREALSGKLPNGVGNTIDWLCETIEDLEARTPDPQTKAHEDKARLEAENARLRKIVSFADEALIPIKGEWARWARANIAKELAALNNESHP